MSKLILNIEGDYANFTGTAKGIKIIHKGNSHLKASRLLMLIKLKSNNYLNLESVHCKMQKLLRFISWLYKNNAKIYCLYYYY